MKPSLPSRVEGSRLASRRPWSSPDLNMLVWKKGSATSLLVRGLHAPSFVRPRSKRQRTGAVQDAGATIEARLTTVTNSFAFHSMTLTATVAPQFTGNGTENYSPDPTSSLRLSYSTPETEDPGRFVSIVPAVELPRVDVIGMSPDTGAVLLIFGRAGGHVIECSPDTVSWVPISTNVMPATVCAVCPFVAVSDRTSSTDGNRFYRVVELP